MKCSLFLLAYKWPTGRVCLKTMNNLAIDPYEVTVKTPTGEEDKVYPSHVKIPEPHEINFPIRAHALKEAVNMFGFYYSLGAPKSGHVKEMIKNGIDWVDRTKTRKLSRRDAWMSLLLSCPQELTRELCQWLSHQRLFRNATKTFTIECQHCLG